MSELKATNTNSEFWKEKWIKNDVGFHQESNHPNLVKHLNKLVGEKKSVRVFFPFCGKAVDMAWLASLGHEVIGVEFVQLACEQFFNENKIKFNVKKVKDFKLFESEDGRIKIYNGDFFKFNTEYEKEFECVWDRGSYTALHFELKVKYTEHVKTLISQNVKYLLDVFDYDTSLYQGPPHACKIDEIKQLYGQGFDVKLIESNLWPENKRFYYPEGFEMWDKLYFITKLF